jgi:hypothetical protein
MVVIKIKKCQDPLMWYSGLVGKNVPFVRHLLSENNFLSREPSGYTNIVKLSDAELVEVLDQEIDFLTFY